MEQQTKIVTFQIDEELKKKGDEILAKMGITPGKFVEMLYAQLVGQQQLPFSTKVEQD